jgi:hypothetical protein
VDKVAKTQQKIEKELSLKRVETEQKEPEDRRICPCSRSDNLPHIVLIRTVFTMSYAVHN